MINSNIKICPVKTFEHRTNPVVNTKSYAVDIDIKFPEEKMHTKKKKSDGAVRLAYRQK